MQRKAFNHIITATAAALAAGLGTLPLAALAQAPTEISFFYPVAVGGTIAKFIDDFAADFTKRSEERRVGKECA